MQSYLDPSALSRSNLGYFGRLKAKQQETLAFLWKWKVAPSSAIRRECYPFLSVSTVNQDLIDLKQRKLIRGVQVSQCPSYLWTLTDLGFELLRDGKSEPDLEGGGSASPWRDLQAIAFQLGEWSSYPLIQVNHLSARDLEQKSGSRLPRWLPKLGSLKPWGISRVVMDVRSVVFAYERVALSTNLRVILEERVQWYDESKSVDAIFWGVADCEARSELVSALQDPQRPRRGHIIVDLHDYQRQGWEALCGLPWSENPTSLRENMRGILGDYYGEILGNYRGLSSVTEYFDSTQLVRKSPSKQSLSPRAFS